MSSFRLRFAAVLVLLLAMSPAHAALLDNSASFEIAAVSYPISRNVQAASTANGFVVVWEEYETLGGPARVFATRVDLQGQIIGSAFAVNTVTSGVKVTSSSLQSFPDGSFVVSWVDAGTQSSVNAQRFDSNASPIGTEFVVAGPTNTQIFGATVAAAGDGTFLVVWQSSAADGRELQAVRYDASGAAVPGVIKPSGRDSTKRGSFSASGSSAGSFVVVWTSAITYQTGAPGGYYPHTRFVGSGRVIEADGTVPAAAFDVGGQYGLNVRHLSDDGFVVVWSDSYRSYDVAAEPLAAYASIRRVDGTTGSMQLSRSGGYDQNGPNTGLAAAGGNGFVVAWSHYGYGPGPVDPADAFVRQVSTGGQSSGDAVPLNLDLPEHVIIDPAVAVSGDRALVAWHEGDAIRGQILEIVGQVLCGDASLDGSLSATDALDALVAAVGGRYCSRLVCDADGDGTIDASDALLILRAAVNQAMAPACS